MTLKFLPTLLDPFARARRAAASAEDARRAAFADLYEAQFGRVFAFLRYRLHDSSLAEELAAETFARAWAKLGSLRSPDSATAWLFATARNLAADHYRGRRAVPLEALLPEQHPLAAAPDGDLLRGERLALVGKCLGDLNEREREVMGLRFVAGLRNREIARVVGTSEGNVAKIIHRALAKLRERLVDAEG